MRCVPCVGDRKYYYYYLLPTTTVYSIRAAMYIMRAVCEMRMIYVGDLGIATSSMLLMCTYVFNIARAHS